MTIIYARIETHHHDTFLLSFYAKVLFGTDSHTCNAGAFGQFATGIGNTDASFVMGTGKLLIKSPASMQFALEGEMPDHLLAKVQIFSWAQGTTEKLLRCRSC